MRIAPASDLMFSQSHRPNGLDDLDFPPRACATTFVGCSAELFGLDRFGTGRERGAAEIYVLGVFLRSAVARGGSRPCQARDEKKKGARRSPDILPIPRDRAYLRCLLTSFVISNIETRLLPPNTGL